MARTRTEQDRVEQILVEIISSHQKLLDIVRRHAPPHIPANYKLAERAPAAAGALLNELRLGEVRVSRWQPPENWICVECGEQFEGAEEDDCPNCGGVVERDE